MRAQGNLRPSQIPNIDVKALLPGARSTFKKATSALAAQETDISQARATSSAGARETVSGPLLEPKCPESTQSVWEDLVLALKQGPQPWDEQQADLGISPEPVLETPASQSRTKQSILSSQTFPELPATETLKNLTKVGTMLCIQYPFRMLVMFKFSILFSQLNSCKLT